MKKLLLILPFILSAPLAMAIDSKDEENYKLNYTKQLHPLVIQKLSADRPEMTAPALKAEADAYVSKMAECQLKGLAGFPEEYREKAIMPVAEGGNVAETTRALNQHMMADIEAGKLSRDEAKMMIGNAQESVQMCLNS
ncbi:MAG TPA: hypothetical protein VFM76_00305 [Methylophaga sp.]|nr:hypothetical protein [Methylophaga sp.]